MTKHYRVAMIGAGKIVQVGHIPSFQTIPNVTAVALCDVTNEGIHWLTNDNKF